jgi:hypothetical protein
MYNFYFMTSLRFGCPIENTPGFRADAVMGDTVFEVLIEPRDVRRLRTAIMDMARIASGGGARRVVLVLQEPRITKSRLHEEWLGAASVIRPELFARLSMMCRHLGEWSGIPVQPDTSELDVLDEIVKHELSLQPARPSRRSEAYYEILRLLIHQWLLGKGPVAINWLIAASGTSYPTVSKSLNRLDYCLDRHSDRSVELRYFPRDEWAQLLAVSGEVRSTAGFADRSGQPRSPESLLRRLRLLQRVDIAVGGVWGARHYRPSLDIIGNPRLDVSVHTTGKAVDLSFVKRLDPALEKITRRDESPILVVHIIRRAASFFQPSDSGLPWADPVECLLDLHEARLESQAFEFLNSFSAAKGQTR